MRPLGIYVHIPFCVRRCPYCGFYSNACGRNGYDDELNEYFEALSEELIRRKDEFAESYYVDSVYFGGGTPSLAAPGLIRGLIDRIAGEFHVTSDCEISMEANPGTLTPERLKGYKDAGVNRLSIGLQSFDDSVLKTLGRIHSAEDFVRSYENARDAGFNNISIDLMFGVPGQTREIWQETLGRTLELQPEHVSFYSLQIEEGTPFYDQYKLGDMVPVSDEEDREMYHDAIRMLAESGYAQYEISNAALSGKECRHNMKYWTFRDYLGIGASASSFIDGVRQTDPGDGYMDYVRCGCPEMYLSENHENSLFDNAADYMITGLRLTSGVSEEDFRERFGKSIWELFPDAMKELKPFLSEGDIVREDGRMYITEKGLDISNKIMTAFV